MKSRYAALIVLAAAVVTGCQKKAAQTASSSVLDIKESPTPVYAAPQPVAAQPVVYDTAPSNGWNNGGNAANPNQTAWNGANASPVGAPSGGSYTVKKGDTLFSIAKSRYGNGNQWQKIATANPGVTPQNLKAGQTIVIP